MVQMKIDSQAIASMRIGGATVLAASNFPDCVIQKQYGMMEVVRIFTLFALESVYNVFSNVIISRSFCFHLC